MKRSDKKKLVLAKRDLRPLTIVQPDLLQHAVGASGCNGCPNTNTIKPK